MHRFPDLILASASPRRLDLLAQIGVVPVRLLAPHIDETPGKREAPARYAERMAREKAHAARALLVPQPEQAVILAADTVVAVGQRILPKAESVEQAETCLELLGGRAHRVHTAVVVIGASGKVRLKRSETRVKVKRLSLEEKRLYLDSLEWHGKAGGYAIQGLFSAYIAHISGSYSAVVGLPLYETTLLLKAEGVVR